MAKTLLNGVNDVLRRVNILAGDTGVLTSLTDSARQPYIDTATQLWNEAIANVFSESGMPVPNQLGEGTITLATNTRNYALASDVVRLHFPLIDKTNNQVIKEFAAGYLAMLEADPEQDDAGLPMYGAIRPSDGQLFLDRAPTATENGRVYTYQYDKDASLSAATDAMPFTDEVYRALVPVVAELWRDSRNMSANQEVVNVNYGRAARLLRGIEARTTWQPRI